MITPKRLSELSCLDLTEFNQLLIGRFALGDLIFASEQFLDANTKQQNYLLHSIKSCEDYAPSVQSEIYKFFDDLINDENINR